MPDASQLAKSRSPAGIGGWLLIFCRLLIVYQPITLAVAVANALGSLSARGLPLAAAIIVRMAVTGFSIAAGLAMTNRQPSAVRLAKVALVLSSSTDVLVYTTSFFPNNLPPGDAPFYVGASLFSRAEIEIRDQIGLDKIMLGTDYPHHEGTFAGAGTREYLKATLGAAHFFAPTHVKSFYMSRRQRSLA